MRSGEPKFFIRFQKPSALPVATAPVPRLTTRQEWERDEAVLALPPTPADEARIRKLSRRSFLWAGVATAGAISGLWAFNRNPPEGAPEGKGLYVPVVDGTKAPLRKVLSFNEGVARNLFYSPTHRAREFPRSEAVTPRNNYNGNTPLVDLAAWNLSLENEAGRGEPRVLTLADLKTLPEVSQTTELKCIEGWSVVVNWTGVRFYDFIRKYPSPSGTQYVALFSEPEGWDDERYYVGLDIESALHPQTLLAYEMNGEPLTPEHGAPLRMVIPTKYGIKCIKLITRIAYTNDRPADYWHERGYDWYAGL